MTFEQGLQLQTGGYKNEDILTKNKLLEFHLEFNHDFSRLYRMQKQNLDVYIISVLVEEVFQEMDKVRKRYHMLAVDRNRA